MHNPLNAYRRTQRELRAQFETFTKRRCPSCPTPCCRQPARIEPSDIRLAEGTGWRAQVLLPPVEAETEENASAPPCHYLAERGCTFPNDLRPFGCTTFICRYMYAEMDRATLTRLKRLVRELKERHALVLRTLPPE